MGKKMLEKTAGLNIACLSKEIAEVMPLAKRKAVHNRALVTSAPPGAVGTVSAALHSVQASRQAAKRARRQAVGSRAVCRLAFFAWARDAIFALHILMGLRAVRHLMLFACN